MRIGIDAQELLNPLRAGIYSYVRNLLVGLHEFATRHQFFLFVSGTHPHTTPQKLSEISDAFPQFAVRAFRSPGRPYRIRLRMDPISRVDVFHHMSSNTFPLSSRCANVFLVPDLSVRRFPEMHTQGNRVHWLRVFEDAKAKADSVITFSEYAKREVSEELSVDPERIHAIPLAPGDEFKPEVDSIRVQKSLDRWGLMAGRYVLSVGTLEPRKNHVTLIRSFSRLLRIADDRTLKLALVGPKGWLYEPIFREIEQLGLEQRVAWIGDADTLVALYNGAAAFVYPSIYEGFGLPPLEAMACGTPVIASSASSLPEVVGNAAILINPLDEERLCFELQRVLNDQALRQALRKRGLARAQLFTWTKTARRTLEAYATARDRASERSRLRWPQNLDRVLRYIKSGKSRGDF